MNTTRTKGFTIIEVVLVLAIAGLIFLMVFIALPTLQRNQRDTQRRDDMARMKAQIAQYQANNKGTVPTNTPAANCNSTTAGTIDVFIANYMEANGSTFTDPDGTDYQSARCLISAGVPATTGQWKYQTGYVCGPNEGTTVAASTRDFAIMIKLEGSGIACVDSKN